MSFTNHIPAAATTGADIGPNIALKAISSVQLNTRILLITTACQNVSVDSLPKLP